MKTASVVFVMACLLGMATNAHSSAQDLKCLEWSDTAGGNVSLDQQLAKDLVSGVWASTRTVAYGDEEVRLVLQFEADGHMSFIKQNEHGHFLEQRRHWYVEVDPEHFLLVLDGEDAPEAFEVAKGCETMILTQVSTRETFEMEFRAKEPTAELLKLRQELIGSWEHMASGMEVVKLRSRGKAQKSTEVTGLLNYRLREDGTYTRRLVNAENGDLIYEESGCWCLSFDGSLLLLRPEGEKDAICAQIKLLNFDELVLEQSLSLEGKLLNRQIDDFYFHKI